MAVAEPRAPVDRSNLPTTTEMVSLADILELLHAEALEVQCASARILGALKLSSPAAREHLLHELNHGPETLRGYAMDALQNLAAEAPIEQFAGLLGTTPAMTQKASDQLVKAGAEALPVLAARIGADASPEFNRAALQTVQRIGSADATGILLDATEKLTGELQRFALEQLVAALPSLSPEQRASLGEDAATRLRRTSREKQQETTVILLRLLGRLRDPEMLPLVTSFIAKTQDAPVLAAAVGAVHNLGEIPAKLHPVVFQKLLVALEHDDYDQIVKPALRTLERIPVTKTMAGAIQKLEKSQHRSVRAFALAQVGALGTPKAFDQLIEALGSPEVKVADAARHALTTNKSYVAPLVAALRDAKTTEEAWRLGRILQRHKDDLPKSAVSSIASGMGSMLGKPSPQFQAYFELLRSVDPELLKSSLFEKGKALFLRKKYAEAADVLRHLDRHDLASGDSDLMLAICRIAGGQKDLTRVARDRHPGLLLLGRIARRVDFDVTAALKRMKGGVEADDLLFAGYFLVERQGVDRAMGGTLLKFVAESFRSSEAGKSAAARLKTERIR